MVNRAVWGFNASKASELLPVAIGTFLPMPNVSN
jgi:hypothetical protein